MIVHARTMESRRPLGVADSLLDPAVGRRRVSAQLSDLRLRDTAFPYLT